MNPPITGNEERVAHYATALTAHTGGLIDAELARHDWQRFQCGCLDRGDHVPDRFRSAIMTGNDDIGGHVQDNGLVFDVSVPGIQVMLAALATELPETTRLDFMDHVWRMVSDGDPEALAPWEGDQCAYHAQFALWLILREGLEQYWETALDTIEVIDSDKDRRAYYSDLLRKGDKRR